MRSRHQPQADSQQQWVQSPDGSMILGPWQSFVTDEPIQVTCGHWIETPVLEGFCNLEPGHDGRCAPPQYEV